MVKSEKQNPIVGTLKLMSPKILGAVGALISPLYFRQSWVGQGFSETH